MLGVAILSGLVVVISLLLFVGRIIPMRLFFGYATQIDVTFTLLMFIVFEGTLGGALTATVAGLFLSVLLTGGRYFLGYSRVAYNWRLGFYTVDFPPKIKQHAKETWKWHKK